MTTRTIDIPGIRAAHPLADVIADSGIAVRRVGRGYLARCPFHDDSTASMSIDAVPDRYHCFGCGATGDVIDYVQRRRQLTFSEAVAYLTHGGLTHGLVQPPRHLPATLRLSIEADRAYAVHDLAWAHFTTPIAHQTAVAYLARRRCLDIRLLEARTGQFAVGLARPGWTSLVDDLRQQGVTDEELLALDLAQTSSRGTLIDTLRNRIIIPVRTDHPATRPSPISGFIGRDVTGRPQVPKYRNPTRTATFDKSSLLFRPILGSAPHGANVIVVEGPLDALAIAAATAAAGRHTAFTPCSTGGTTVSPVQAQRVTNLADEADGLVVLALDGDAAGAQGTLRWLDTLVRESGTSTLARIRVAHLPIGRDPADWLAQHGAAGLALFDPHGPVRYAAVPPGAEIVRHTIAALPSRGVTDPTSAVIHALSPLAEVLLPSDRSALLTSASREMRRQGWDANDSFTKALLGAGFTAPRPPRGLSAEASMPYSKPSPAIQLTVR